MLVGFDSGGFALDDGPRTLGSCHIETGCDKQMIFFSVFEGAKRFCFFFHGNSRVSFVCLLGDFMRIRSHGMKITIFHHHLGNTLVIFSNHQTVTNQEF